jgi:hypothetical protein
VGLEVRGVHGWTTHAITTTRKISWNRNGWPIKGSWCYYYICTFGNKSFLCNTQFFIPRTHILARNLSSLGLMYNGMCCVAPGKVLKRNLGARYLDEPIFLDGRWNENNALLHLACFIM